MHDIHTSIHPKHDITRERVLQGRRLTCFADKKAREEMAKNAGKKGPMNTGQQGIKKSGKK
jgi:hypothetical protein